MNNKGILNTLDISEVAITDGLVAWWPLNGNANDVSGNSNHGTIYSAPTIVDGLNGKSCYLFNGTTDYIDITACSSLIPSENDVGSVFCWVYPTATGVNRYVLHGMGSNTNRHYLSWNNQTLSVSRGNPSAGVTLMTNVPLNNWYHIGMGWNSQTIYGYLNGNLIGTNNYTNSSTTKLTVLWIARQSESTHYTGKIQDFRIYNRLLLTTDVKILYDITNPFNTIKIKQSKNMLYLKGQIKEY